MSVFDMLQQDLNRHVRQLNKEADEEAREERAKDVIVEAMQGDYVEQEAILDRLGLPREEYYSEFDDEHDLADAYFDRILDEEDKAAAEWNLNMVLNR